MMSNNVQVLFENKNNIKMNKTLLNKIKMTIGITSNCL